MLSYINARLSRETEGKDKVIPFTFGFIPTEKVWFESIWFIFDAVGIYSLVVQRFMEGKGLV